VILLTDFVDFSQIGVMRIDAVLQDRLVAANYAVDLFVLAKRSCDNRDINSLRCC
jgi:hypothetical protein